MRVIESSATTYAETVGKVANVAIIVTFARRLSSASAPPILPFRGGHVSRRLTRCQQLGEIRKQLLLLRASFPMFEFPAVSLPIPAMSPFPVADSSR